MKIIVTGAAGFIGSNITEELVKGGNEVTALDNFHTGNQENLKNVLDKIKFVKSETGKFFEDLEEKYDAVCHQGIYSSSPMYKENPHLTTKIIDEFISILEYARRNKIKKIVFASTSSIYNGHEPPHKEEMAPLIKDLYSEGRYAMERIGQLYHELYGINVVGLRYFSVYGPHEKSKGRYANLISQFLWDLMQDKTPVVYGDGSQKRDFTYVSDIVKANVLALEKIVNGIFNVGTGDSVSINEMIEILNKKLGKNIETEYVENPIKNYVYVTDADMNKAKKELGFEAEVTLEQGIFKLIGYYRE